MFTETGRPRAVEAVGMVGVQGSSGTIRWGGGGKSLVVDEGGLAGWRNSKSDAKWVEKNDHGPCYHDLRAMKQQKKFSNDWPLPRPIFFSPYIRILHMNSTRIQFIQLFMDLYSIENTLMDKMNIFPFVTISYLAEL